MKNKRKILITSIITLSPILVGLILWNRLPDEIAIHFNSGGVADNWCYKGWVVFGMPVLILLIHCLCIFITAHDPKRKNISDNLFGIVFWICPACSVLGCSISYVYALKIDLSINSIIHMVLGLLLIILGNYLPKTRQNHTMGIKLPWTLNDKENWNSTHRFAGWVWIAGGFILLINAFINNRIISIATIILIMLIPAIYSFVYNKNRSNR